MMLTPRTTYHHGDLRHAAIKRGKAIIAKQGISALGMRRVADDLSVSAPALYRHFNSLEDFQQAISAEIRSDLADFLCQMRDQLASHRSPAQNAKLRMRTIGEAYIDFARANPRLFEIAFLNCEPDRENDVAWKVLQAALNDLATSGVLERRAQSAASMLAWSAVHGLASLVAQRAIGANEYDEIKKVVLDGVSRAIGY